jgi:hypothetical protein
MSEESIIDNNGGNKRDIISIINSTVHAVVFKIDVFDL